MLNRKTIFISLVLLVLLFAFNSAEAQCAMCKQSAESSLKNDPRSIARGLNSGILYLMAVPYIMLALIFRKQLKALFFKLKNRLTKKGATNFTN